MSSAPEESSQKSGAAGAANFVGADSRRFNYFDPKGRRASHYEDVTVDVQPDPKRYLLQDWIISFSDGTPSYFEDWTTIRSSNWHMFRAVDQEWERTHYQRQSNTIGTLGTMISGARASGAPRRFEEPWVRALQDHVGAYKHAEFGLGTSLMRAQRFGPTQMINNAILTNSSYKLRFAQDLALFLGDLALDLDNFDPSAGKVHWLDDPIWQDTRRAVESIMGTSDYLEQYFAINVIFEPLIGELFRGGFVMQAAAKQNDYMSPVIASVANEDYKRNLANAVELFSMLARDEVFGEANRTQFALWADVHGRLCLNGAMSLRPIWLLEGSDGIDFDMAFEVATRRLNTIASEVGIDPSLLRSAS